MSTQVQAARRGRRARGARPRAARWPRSCTRCGRSPGDTSPRNWLVLPMTRPGTPNLRYGHLVVVKLDTLKLMVTRQIDVVCVCDEQIWENTGYSVVHCYHDTETFLAYLMCN